jgi:hypothetical protein
MRTIILILCLTCVSFETLRAQGGYWTHTGSSGDSTIVGIVSQTATIFCVTTNGTVMKSVNNGVSWTRLAKELGHTTSLSRDALNQITLYAGGDAGVLISGTGTGWKNVSTGMTNRKVNTMFMFPSNALEVGTSSGVQFTQDRGVTWSESNDALLDLHVQATGGNSNYVYAGTPTGLFIGANGASAWQTMNLGTVDVRSIWVYGNSGTIYVGGINAIHQSADFGVHWNTLTTTIAQVQAILRAGNTLLAGTSKGLLVSENNGVKWVRASAGMTDSNVTSIFYASDGHIVIGTQSGQLYRSYKVVTSLLGVYEDNVSSKWNIYPNPASQIVHIRAVASERASQVVLSDVLGRIVKRSSILAGATTADVAVENLPTGSYLLQIRSGDVLHTERIAIVK